MEGAFAVARKAARNVSRGWVQYKFKEGHRVCAVQAVDSAGYGAAEKALVLEELEHQIQMTPSYRIISWLAPRMKWDRRQRLITWNDTPGRRKHQVVAAFEAVADRLEAQARREECERLEAAIANLQNYIIKQQEYVTALEEQVVSFWKRRKQRGEVVQGKDKLGQMRSELEDMRVQLGDLKAA